MHIEARLFEFLTAFFVLAAVVYAVLTAMFQYGGVEWAGVTALVLMTMRPIRGTLCRASNVNQRPSRKTSNQALKSIGAGSLGTPISPR